MAMVKIESLEEFYDYLDAECLHTSCAISLEYEGYNDDLLDRCFVWEFAEDSKWSIAWIEARIKHLNSHCILTGCDKDGTIVAVCEVAANGRPTVMDTEP